jgi:hypothetical protein
MPITTETFESIYGSTGNYIVCTKVTVNHKGGESIEIEGWLNAAAYAAGDDSLAMWTCALGNEDKKNTDGVWTRIKLADIDANDLTTIETKIQGGKIELGTSIVDFTD